MNATSMVDDAAADEVDDVELMRQISVGNDAAMAALVRRYQRELVGFFYNHLWNLTTAEELAQDTFVNCFRARERWQPSAKVRTYLYRIAHNLWIDHLRRQKRYVSLDQEDGDGHSMAGSIPAPIHPQESSPGRAGEIRDRVRQALELLTSGHREVFVLANNHGMKYQEIAAVLGIPEGTVKSRMHHAVRILRDELSDLVEEDS